METETLAGAVNGADVFAENGIEKYTKLLPRLGTFARLLLEENEKHNLTAVRNPDEVWVRHFADILLFADVFAGGGKMVDIGCGGGFPTVPLALACPTLTVTALDSTAKKVDFVARAAKELALPNVKTLVARAEDAGRNVVWRERFDFAVARAVSALPALAEYCLPLVKVGGCFCAFKGQGVDEELAAAAPLIANLGGKVEDVLYKTLHDPNGETMERALVIVRKTRATPSCFPRKNSVIQRAKTQKAGAK